MAKESQWHCFLLFSTHDDANSIVQGSEYAGHAATRIFGCILCSPDCEVILQVL